MTLVQRLLEKGARIPDPASVFIAGDVRPERICAENLVIHPGCRISGPSTLIMAGAKLGFEAPATIVDCQIGPGVELSGGFFQGAVFLEKAAMGSSAHVREGTILEERARAAHAVGLKHTILFPYATLGSLINFCDCLLAGGTNEKNHSEVGSSYIHFNYTPQQDKATASLIGDVPEGVMLRSDPIFLGGQGGLVGPCRIAYGTVVAAGTIWRNDQGKKNRLVFAGLPPGKGDAPFTPGLYRNIKRVVQNNVLYIANLLALQSWYADARGLFVHGGLETALHAGLMEKCSLAIQERIKRLGQLAQNMSRSASILEEMTPGAPSSALAQQNELYARWPEVETCLKEFLPPRDRYKDAFLLTLTDGIKKNGPGYLDVIHGLSPDQAALGTRWLQGIVDQASQAVFSILASLA